MSGDLLPEKLPLTRDKIKTKTKLYYRKCRRLRTPVTWREARLRTLWWEYRLQGVVMDWASIMGSDE